MLEQYFLSPNIQLDLFVSPDCGIAVGESFYIWKQLFYVSAIYCRISNYKKSLFLENNFIGKLRGIQCFSFRTLS